MGVSTLRIRALRSTSALGVLVLAVCALAAPGAWAAPERQSGTTGSAGPNAAVSYLWPQRPSGLFGGPRVTAYVQVYDKADPPAGRSAVTGLPASAFSAAEDGQAVSLTVKPVAPDDPVALIVVADTSTGRG